MEALGFFREEKEWDPFFFFSRVERRIGFLFCFKSCFVSSARKSCTGGFFGLVCLLPDCKGERSTRYRWFWLLRPHHPVLDLVVLGFSDVQLVFSFSRGQGADVRILDFGVPVPKKAF